jgi:uncharacterized protein YndB with AHSA1/START domain
VADILMQVDIDAPRAHVVDALTTHSGITGWWTAKGEVPHGKGQTMMLSFRPHAPLPFDLTVEESSDDHIVWRPVSFPPHWVGTRISWELNDTPERAATRVLLQHTSWRDGDPQLPPAAYTWGQLLGVLKAFCETGNPQPMFAGE